MTVLSTASSSRFHGAGGVGPFTWPWRFLANADLEVYRIPNPNEDDPSAETLELLTYGIDYTLTGAGSFTGGSLTLSEALPVGADLRVLRMTEATQSVSIRNQGNNFRPEVHEDAFDRLTMIVQDRTRETDENGDDLAGLKPRMAAAEATLSDHEARVSEAENAIIDIAMGREILDDFTRTIRPADIITKGPWVDARAFNDMVSADTYAAEHGLGLLITTVWPVPVALTVNSPVLILPGGGFSGGGALNLYGSVQAGLYQIFFDTLSVVFGRSTVSAVTPQWWGAKGDDVATNEEVAINKAFASAKSSFCKVRIPSGIYKTGAPIRSNVPFSGDDGLRTIIKPQAAFAAFDILTCSTGEIGNFLVDYSDLAPAAVTSACVGLRLMNESVAAGQQIVFTTFRNILVQYGWDGVRYDAAGAPNKGQLYMVTFDHVAVQYCQGFGFYLYCTSGTLSVDFRQCSVDAPRSGDGFFNALSATARGYYLYNMAVVTMDNCIASRIEANAVARVAQFNSIHSLSLRNFQHEGTNLTFGGSSSGPIAFFACEQVDLDIRCQTQTINTTGAVIAPYLYFDTGTKNVIIRAMTEQNITTTSGVRKFFTVQTGNVNTNIITVLDGTMLRSDCDIPTALADDVYLRSDQLSLDSNPSARRRLATRITTTAGVATPLLSAANYGIYNTPISGLYIVNGSRTTDSNVGFTDLIMIRTSSGGALTVYVISSNNTGAAGARTYSVTGGNIAVSIPTVTYYVNITGFDQTGTGN